jgi:hypothetical protein
VPCINAVKALVKKSADTPMTTIPILCFGGITSELTATVTSFAKCVCTLSPAIAAG